MVTDVDERGLEVKYKDGRVERIDAVTKVWTGHWPANRAPVLEEADVPLANRAVTGGASVTATARYRDPEGRPLRYEWEIRRESDDRREGGDREREPELVAGCITDSTGDGRVVVQAPRAAGGYRLFVTVRDGEGSGCIDNWPFAVAGEKTIAPAESADRP